MALDNGRRRSLQPGRSANFKTQAELDSRRVSAGVQCVVAASIRVVAAEEAVPDFHARWNAAAKLTGTGSFADASFRHSCGATCSMILFRWTLCDGEARDDSRRTRFHFIPASTDRKKTTASER